MLVTITSVTIEDDGRIHVTGELDGGDYKCSFESEAALRSAPTNEDEGLPARMLAGAMIDPAVYGDDAIDGSFAAWPAMVEVEDQVG